MNVSKMSREKIAAALAKGGRYMNHARQWVAVKVGERVNPDDIALALVSPDALIVREAVRMASKAGRGAKRAAGETIRRDLALRVWAIHPAAALSKLRSEKGLR